MTDLIASLIDDQSLAAAVQALAQSNPEADQVLTRLLTHFQQKLNTQQQKYGSSSGEPDAKRMRLDGSTPLSSSSAAGSPSSSTPIWPPPTTTDFGPAIYSTTPLSLLHPIRKKLTLRFHQHNIALVNMSGATAGGEGGEVIAAAPWSALYRVIAVPFLERTTKQTAVLLFFRHHAVPTPKDAIWAVTVADDGKDFTLTCATNHLHLLSLTSDLRDNAPSKKPDTILLAIIARCVEHNTQNNHEETNDCEIVANPSPSYPSFSAHLKSSQGTIYLLPRGILFAFKKPIIYLPATKIDAIGFHSIVSRTFDFEVVISEDASPEDCEGVPPAPSSGTTNNAGTGGAKQRRTIGFGMVDTKEFAKVEDWIKKSGIRDRSMSEDLKAKDKAPLSSKKRERKEDEDDEDEADENDAKKIAANGSASVDKGKGKAVAVQHEEDSDDEDDEDFAPESEDEDMVEEYDSEAIGTDNEDEERATTRAQGSSSSSARQRGSQHDDDDDGESLGEDTDEEDEDEDDELEEEEEEDGEGGVDDEEEETKDEKDDASVDLEADGEEEDDDAEDEEHAAEDALEEDLHSDEGGDMEEDEPEDDDEEEEIDELEED